jgi:hypothetical protein
MGDIKGTIDVESNVWIPHNRIFSLVFFMVNDCSKFFTATTIQTMHFVNCHFVSWTHNFSNITKKRKGVIAYNQQNEIISMKKHVTFEHKDVQVRLKSINLSLVAKK